jgi:hypothetical protein
MLFLQQDGASMTKQIRTPIVGSRVIVRIQDPSEYAYGCANALQSAGVHYRTRETPFTRVNLVRFNKLPKKWWPNGNEVTGFWFPAKDLEVLT